MSHTSDPYTEFGKVLTSQPLDSPLGEDSVLKHGPDNTLIETGSDPLRQRDEASGDVIAEITQDTQPSDMELPPPSIAGSDSRLRLVERGCRERPGYVAGQLEYQLDSGSWGLVCDDCFGQQSVKVACRELGYETGILADEGAQTCDHPYGTRDSGCSADTSSG